MTVAPLIPFTFDWLLLGTNWVLGSVMITGTYLSSFALIFLSECSSEKLACSSNDTWHCLDEKYICEKTALVGGTIIIMIIFLSECSSEKLACSSNETWHCLDEKYICDRREDCADGRDETDRCRKFMWLCLYIMLFQLQMGKVNWSDILYLEFIIPLQNL